MWTRVGWRSGASVLLSGGILLVAAVQSSGMEQRGQRDLGAKDPGAGSAGIPIRAGILASFSASVPLIIHPSPIPSVLGPPAGVRMDGMPETAKARSVHACLAIEQVPFPEPH